MTDPAVTEARFLGCVLCEPQRNIVAAMREGVKASWFTSDGAAAVWTAVERIWAAGNAGRADGAAIYQEAQRVASEDGWKEPAERLATLDWFDQLVDGTMPPFDCIMHLYALRAAHCEREIRKAVGEGYKSFGIDWRQGAVTIRNGVDRVLGDATDGAKLDAPEIYASIMGEYREAYRQRVDPEGPRNLEWVPGLTMPWPELTRSFLGLRPGLHIVAARPSVGKTSYAVNLIRYWLDCGKSVIFDSLDMPRREVMRRFVAERSRVSAAKAIFTPTLHNITAMEDAVKTMNALPLAFVEERRVEDFVTRLAVEKSRGACDVAVVDYLQLLHGEKLDNANEYARVSYVSDALKAAANELEVPIVALSQLNRDSAKNGEQRMPTIADLRGSGSIEQDAFTVTILHRDETVVKGWRESPPYWLFDDENYGRTHAVQYLDAIHVIVAKAQNGGRGVSYPFIVHGPYFAWKLADYMAKASEGTSGYGAAAKVTVDNSPKFRRIHRDWRGDTWEKSLEGKLLPFMTDEGPAEVLI